MNKYTLGLLAMLCLMSSASMWQTHTNSSHVYDILAENGEIWFSSWGGVLHIGATGGAESTPLSSFEQIDVWNSSNGLLSNDIRHIRRIGFSSSFWFASETSGISIVSPMGIQTLNSNVGLPSNRVRKILEHQSRILVATYSGLAEYYYLEGVNFPLMLHQYNVQNTSGAMLSDELDAMELGSNGYLWLASQQGINYVHLDSLAMDSAWHTLSTPMAGNQSYKLAINQNKLAIATSYAVYLHSSDPWQAGWTSYTAGVHLPDETISDIALDDEDNLWISYGLWREDLLSFTHQGSTLFSTVSPDGQVSNTSENTDGLKRKSISRIVFQDGRIYLGSWGEGIFRNEDGTWVQFVPNSIGFPKITHIATDQNNEVWISSGNFNHLPTRKSALGTSRWLNGTWHTMTTANSPIQSDNILSIAVDSKNRKWFGTYDVQQHQSPPDWNFGLTIFDEENDIWKHITNLGMRIWNKETGSWGLILPNTPRLRGNTIGYIAKDTHDNILIACYDRGYVVINSEDEQIGSFEIPNSVYQRGIFIYHNGRQYFFGTQNDRGIMIWNDDSIPETGGAHWITPPVPELNSCYVYGVVSIQSPYEGIQHWIATSTGLFMWDESYWYKYDTAIKRYRYNTNASRWDNDLLYYADEERLYASVRTTPTAIFLDPFGRIWIGSQENGISMYNPKSERFTNYYQANSPLLSNHITMFGFEPTEGLLLIGTPDGLNTLKIGRTIKPENKLESVKAYPNPFRPALHKSVIISNQPSDVMPHGKNTCRIYDSSGALVAKLQETPFSRFEWDGFSESDKPCASGVYYFIITDDNGNTKKGKIVLIR